jgi:hypothetical protein
MTVKIGGKTTQTRRGKFEQDDNIQKEDGELEI